MTATAERTEREAAADSHDELALHVWEGEGGSTVEDDSENSYLRDYPYDIACR